MITRTKGLSVYSYRGMPFAVDIPVTLKWDEPVNILYFFKGKGGKGEKLDPYRSRRGLVAPFLPLTNTIGVYPEAIDPKLGWRISGIGSTTDIGNIHNLRNLLIKDLAIVPSKSFGFGISNGGCFVHLLATQLTIFDKIGVAAANLWIGHPVLKPIPYMHFHGELDMSCPYKGGYAHGYTFYSTLDTFKKYVGTISAYSECTVVKIGYNTVTHGISDKGKEVTLVTNSMAAHNILSQSTPQYDYMKELFQFFL